MKELIGYEIKKILMRRVNRIAMLFGLILIIFSNLALIHSESFPVNDTEYCTGREAFQKQAEAENALTTQLSEEFLTGFLQDYQQGLPTNAVTLREPAYCKEAESSTPAKSPAYDWSLIAPYANLFSLIANHYREWNDSFAWEDLGQIPAEHGIHFYERRLEKIDTMLESDYTYGNYSEAEKAYWRSKAGNVSIPFAWGNRDVWNRIWDSIGINVCLLPLHCFNLKDLLRMYISYPVGGMVISYLDMVFISYTLLLLLCILCTGKFFRTHQAGG